MFVLYHYFSLQSFVAVRKELSISYHDKEVPCQTTVHQLVTTFQNRGNVWEEKHVPCRTVLTGNTLRNVIGTLQNDSLVAILVSRKLTNMAVVGVAF